MIRSATVEAALSPRRLSATIALQFQDHLELVNMSYDFTGKRALVTGGGSGLGRATALRLAKLGAKVFALSHIQADLDSLKAENPDIEVMCLDLLDVAKCREAVQKITPIQLLVNCAGIFAPSPLLEVPMEEFDLLFGVNVKSMLYVTQVVARDLLQRNEKGSVVNIGSIASERIFRGWNASTYIATKYAVKAYTKSMAAELSPKGIRVNSVNPSFMKTAMTSSITSEEDPLLSPILARTPLNKIAELDDVVNAIVFLLSSQSDMITGHELVVDGGYLCT